MGEERIWTKRGSRIQLPRVPRLSRATLLRAIPSVGVVSLTLIGLLAVPAGSPTPPLPAVAATPITTATYSEPNPPAVTKESPLVCDPTVEAGKVILREPGASKATGIVYADQGNIVLFSGIRQTLIGNATNCTFSQPHFINRRTIAFITRYGPDSFLGSIDTVTGVVKGIPMNLPGLNLQSFDVSPSGEDLALLGDSTGDSFTLAVSSTFDGQAFFVTHLGWDCACGYTGEVEMSRDGSLVLVGVPEKHGAPESIYVFDRAGNQVVPPLAGDTPRWIGSTHRFIFNAYERTTRRWTLVDVDTRSQHPLVGVNPGWSDPEASPDGTKIAFDDMTKVKVVIYELRSGSLRSLNAMELFPLWITTEVVAVSKVGLIGCDGCIPYAPTGTVIQFSVQKGTRVPARFRQTQDADVWF